MSKFHTVISALLFYLTVIPSFGQNEHENLRKYWSYKNRLQQYFMKTGYEEAGESEIFVCRNQYKNKFSDGDQTIYLGWYMGVLATEFKLLQYYKQDTKKTSYDLYCAFKAYQRLDECEDKAPWFKNKPVFNGFFVRSDYDQNFVVKNLGHFNKNIAKSSTSNDGQPEPIDGIVASKNPSPPEYNSMSQDQAIHLLMGLALVNKSMPDTIIKIFNTDSVLIDSLNFKKQAQLITHNIVSYIQNKNKENGPKRWVIYMPDGNKVPRGAMAASYAYAIAKAGENITGIKYTKGDPSLILYEPIWQKYCTTWYFVTYFNNTLASVIAAISNSWQKNKIAIGNVIISNGNNATYTRLKRYAGSWDTESFYLLLWKFVNNIDTDEYKSWENVVEKARFQLAEAPVNGPYSYGKENAATGWATDLKFGYIPKEQKYGHIYGNNRSGNYAKGCFNGLDYMLLFNLYRLEKINSNLPVYSTQ